MQLALEVEPLFHPDSYGYRPGRSALDAVATCRQRCWKADSVIDLDIGAFFTAIPHDGLMSALSERISDRKVLALLRAFLPAGSWRTERCRRPVTDAPQGGVVSPLLGNVYLTRAGPGPASRLWTSGPLRR